LTAPARGAGVDLRSGRRNASRGRTKEWPAKENHKAFGRVADTSLPEAESPRRDDGSGQTVAHPVALPPRHRRLVGRSSHQHHQVAASRRPRTEASTRRPDNANRGLTHRPVTEGWAKSLGTADVTTPGATRFCPRGPTKPRVSTAWAKARTALMNAVSRARRLCPPEAGKAGTKQGYHGGMGDGGGEPR
jgi:hypothetical protein